MKRNCFLSLHLKNMSWYIANNRTDAMFLGRNRRSHPHTNLVFLSTECARRVLLVLFTNMDTVVSRARAGEVESVVNHTVRCLLISDARLVQSPSFPMVEALYSPVFNWTIPESSAPWLKQKKVRLGFIAKELALFEVFLRNNSQNSRNRQVFWLFFWCVGVFINKGSSI